VIFGCKKYHPYLEHKEFELQCDNLALCWLLKKVKDIGRLGRWILRLALYKFRVEHTRGSENVVADALSRMFEETPVEVPELSCKAIWQTLPLVYSSLGEHQLEDPYCMDLRDRLRANPGSVDSFQISRDLLCFYPKKAKRRRWIIPASLKSMLLQYYHDSALAGHLGARKTFQKIATNFWWTRMQAEIFKYVRKCDLCQRAKPAQDARVGMHASNPCSRPTERLFVDFVGPLTRSKRGNIAILVVVDAFSKFVSFFPVRRTTSQMVVDCLEKWYFPAYGTPTSVVTDNARIFCCKHFREMCFRWGLTHITTTPYYPQASLAERVNHNLKSALKIFHHESQSEWDTVLPWLGLAFNTAVHDSTKCTPD
jgi:transposase InsO family protein